MSRTIYVKNERVNEIFNNSSNVSDLIEKSVLFYHNEKSKELLTEDQVRKLFCDLTTEWLKLVHKK